MGIALPTVTSGIETDFSRTFSLIYGEPKIGKSTLASTFPSPLFIATEEGLRFLDVYKVSCRDWIEFSDIVKELKGDAAKKLYGTIVIDTIDLLYNWCQIFVCDRHNIRHPSEEEWGKGWDYVKTEFQRGCRYLVSEGYGVVFISHSRVVERTIKGLKRDVVVPTFTGTARKIILPLVDFYFFLSPDLENPELSEHRKIYCRPTGAFEAGSRQKFFPEHIDDISYESIATTLEIAAAAEVAEKLEKEDKKPEIEVVETAETMSSETESIYDEELKQ